MLCLNQSSSCNKVPGIFVRLFILSTSLQTWLEKGHKKNKWEWVSTAPEYKTQSALSTLPHTLSVFCGQSIKNSQPFNYRPSRNCLREPDHFVPGDGVLKPCQADLIENWPFVVKDLRTESSFPESGCRFGGMWAKISLTTRFLGLSQCHVLSLVVEATMEFWDLRRLWSSLSSNQSFKGPKGCQIWYHRKALRPFPTTDVIQTWTFCLTLKILWSKKQ